MDVNNMIKEQVEPITPWWTPPYEADWFDYANDATINNTTGITVLFTFTIPSSSIGVIRWFGQDVDDITKENSVVWRIKLNDAPDEVYGYIKGSISTLKAPTETLIRLSKGVKVSLEVYTTNIANLVVKGRLKGWTWTEEYSNANRF